MRPCRPLQPMRCGASGWCYSIRWCACATRPRWIRCREAADVRRLMMKLLPALLIGLLLARAETVRAQPGEAPAARADNERVEAAQDAQLERRLDDARARLEAAARELAELSTKLAPQEP